jgi:hypothetical protein
MQMDEDQQNRSDEHPVIATCAECGEGILSGLGDYNRWKGRELHGKCMRKAMGLPPWNESAKGAA